MNLKMLLRISSLLRGFVPDGVRVVVVVVVVGVVLVIVVVVVGVVVMCPLLRGFLPDGVRVVVVVVVVVVVGVVVMLFTSVVATVVNSTDVRLPNTKQTTVSIDEFATRTKHICIIEIRFVSGSNYIFLIYKMRRNEAI